MRIDLQAEGADNTKPLRNQSKDFWLMERGRGSVGDKVGEVRQGREWAAFFVCHLSSTD